MDPAADMPDVFQSVDRYLARALGVSDGALAGALTESERAGLPAIQVAPNQGRLLEILARAIGARRVLEVGTLGGYSTIFLARGVGPTGRVVTLELDPGHAEVARRNLAKAGVAERVDVVVGSASQTLPRLVGDPRSPFDLVFIDADKASTPDYLGWSLRLARVGTLIVIDNVVRGGAVADESSSDAGVLGIRRAMEMIAGEPRLVGTAIQTVGAKGHDGLAFALVVGQAL